MKPVLSLMLRFLLAIVVGKILSIIPLLFFGKNALNSVGAEVTFFGLIVVAFLITWWLFGKKLDPYFEGMGRSDKVKKQETYLIQTFAGIFIWVMLLASFMTSPVYFSTTASVGSIYDIENEGPLENSTFYHIEDYEINKDEVLTRTTFERAYHGEDHAREGELAYTEVQVDHYMPLTDTLKHTFYGNSHRFWFKNAIYNVNTALKFYHDEQLYDDEARFRFFADSIIYDSEIQNANMSFDDISYFRVFKMSQEAKDLLGITTPSAYLFSAFYGSHTDIIWDQIAFLFWMLLFFSVAFFSLIAGLKIVAIRRARKFR